MQLRDKQELRQAEMAMLDHLMEKVGMGAELRKQMLAGGGAAAKFAQAMKQESARRAQAADGQTERSKEQPGSVTPEKPDGGVAGPESLPHDSLKCMEINDLRAETGGMPDVMHDVTQDVTPEGMSHGFATA